MSLDIGDEQFFAVGGNEDSTGIPARRDQSGDRTACRFAVLVCASVCTEADDGEASSLERLERAVLRELASVERLRAQLGAAPQGCGSR